jgi:hypothetical protein
MGLAIGGIFSADVVFDFRIGGDGAHIFGAKYFVFQMKGSYEPEQGAFSAIFGDFATCRGLIFVAGSVLEGDRHPQRRFIWCGTNKKFEIARVEYVRQIHVFAGCVVAITGLMQIVLPKGGLRHRIIGQCYFWSWVLIVPTGAYLGSAIITLFGALGLYMAYTGYRLGIRKSMELALLDKGFIVVGFAAGLFTLGWGISLLALGKGGFFAIIACFFGLLFAAAGFRDVRQFLLGKKVGKLSGHRLHWWFEHYGRMYISYIAAMTAFAAIQQLFPIPILDWVLPTLIGTVLIIVTNRINRKKQKIA